MTYELVIDDERLDEPDWEDCIDGAKKRGHDDVVDLLKRRRVTDPLYYACRSKNSIW